MKKENIARAIWDRQLAETVFNILIQEAGAAEALREAFVQYQLQHGSEPFRSFPTEFRFMGDLGIGGKFYREPFDHNRPLRVSCYPEDENPERMKKIHRTNRALEALGQLHARE